MHYRSRLPRSPLSAYLVMSTICMVLFVTMLMSACNRSQRVDTLHTSLISVTAARDGFTAWDLLHQQQLVDAATSKEAGQQALASYREKRQPIVNGFEVAYRAIALAATQTDDLSLNAALSRADELVDAVNKMIHGGT